MPAMHLSAPLPDAPPQMRSARAPAATLLLLLLAAGLMAARWLTRSRYLFDLDSVLYVRALDHYDVRLQQPPLPGYYLYIQLGRLTRGLFSLWGNRDDNLVFVALSVVFGLLIVVGLYVLALELFGDRRTARIAAVLGLTGPIFWYQGNVASPRIAEGFSAVLIVYLGVRLRRRGERRLRGDLWAFWLLPVALAMAAGVRQQSFFYLLPFCVWATWQTPWRLRLAGVALLVLGLVSWFVPMCQASGGLGEVRRLSKDYLQLFVVNGTGVFYAPTLRDALHRLLVNTTAVTLYTFFTGMLALLFLPALMGKRGDLPLRSFPAQALLLALLPGLLFSCLVHIMQIGHFLTIAPFLALLCARALAGAPAAPLMTAAVALANLAFIFFYPPRLIGERIGTPTVASIRARDRFAEASIAATRRAGTPENTLVISAPMSYGFVEYYLPGYRYYLMPGLFESGGAQSRSQQILTNGFKPLDERLRRGVGRVAAPPEVRRFVTVGWDVEVGRWVDPAARPERPAPDVPALAMVRRDQPTVLEFRPGRLSFRP